MTTTIYKRNKDSEESMYSKFKYDSDLYDTVEKKFASVMWKHLVEKKFGYQFGYISDYYDYIKFYNKFGYEGAGIYCDGKMIMSEEDLEDGIRDIEIKNILYFIL